RVALVVGNNDYHDVPSLSKAVNDAHTMASTLKQLGFTVIVALNLTRRQFSETLLNFDNALEAGDTAFFFYAGHGFEILGQNYLLPVDVPAATDGEAELVRDAAILADRIVERLQNRKVRSAILVFDACRNNPFERSGVRALPGDGGLAPMTQLPEGVFSVFSAGPRQTALDRLSEDDANPNSVFTRIFARELLKPGVSLVQVMQETRRVVAEVAETVRHRQVPAYFDQMVDDVFLNGKAPDTRPAAPAQQLAALGPATEPEQRMAFLSFLQDRIINPRITAVPVMTDRERHELGPYAAHYDAMFNFNQAMTAATAEVAYAMRAQGRFSNAQKMRDNWPELAPARAQLRRFNDTYTAECKKLEDLRARLNLPDEVKNVYDMAYAKLVTNRTKGLDVLLPALDELFQETENVGRFLTDNRARVKVIDDTIKIRDPQLVVEWKELQLRYMNAAQRVSVALAEVPKG
ncbi:MAG: DUF3053 family protein, partial [Alphaproteobacteria bacterium]|nr:DUF3053 family protein [Alphaproteobacteria bacterium]